MAVNKPRNRTLIFRLTQEEYDSLQAASSGARSLSDYARAKLLASVGPTGLDSQLMELKNTMERLAQRLERD